MDWIIAAGFAGAAAAAGATGALFRPGAWYAGLEKPNWTPPDWAFPVAWTLLYILMTVAAVRVAAALAEGASPEPAWAAAGLGFWAMQISLNAMWSPLFFGVRRPRAALACISVLWLAILATLLCFARANWLSAALMVPYLAWVSYAAALNLSLLKRNPPGVWGRPG